MRKRDYQDYVIRDGKFIGDFENMYQNCEAPWEQSTREKNISYKEIAIHLCKQYKFKKILEFGCGYGHFSNELQYAGFEITAVDIAPTAIKKATILYPKCNFIVGDILDFEIYKLIQPDCIILSEITWYILNKLDKFIDFYKHYRNRDNNTPYLIHLLATYANGQKYGIDKFTDIDGILKYFNLDYEEYGTITYKKLSNDMRTYFLGKPFTT